MASDRPDDKPQPATHSAHASEPGGSPKKVPRFDENAYCRVVSLEILALCLLSHVIFTSENPKETANKLRQTALNSLDFWERLGPDEETTERVREKIRRDIKSTFDGAINPSKLHRA